MASKPRDKFAVAKSFKALRQRSLMSQAGLAGVIGLCRQSVNKIENGHVTPHYTTLQKFRNLEAKHEQARALTLALASSRPW